MKRNWFITICIFITVVTLSIGCNPGNNGKIVSITCDDMQKQESITKNIEIAVGDTFTVDLCSNRTTGFTWEGTEKIGSPDIVEQSSYKWISPEESGKVGVAGREVWTFKGLKAGSSTVSMEYSQPWPGGTKAVTKLTVNVTVK